MIGTRIKQYEILDEIGMGGMATVYRARDTRTGHIVAVKVMHPHLSRNPTYVERLRREAETALSLDDPHIVKVLDYGEEKGSYFLVMEYVKGKTLQQLIQERGSLTIEQAVDIARQVAKALDTAHRQGIIHRDIKPQNLMVTSEGSVKVMDFGIARAADFSTITQTGIFMGSPHYVSPEQAKGLRQMDIRSDVYSLGVVLYQMLTGVLPFDAETPWTVLHQHVETKAVPAHEHRADVPPEVEAVVEKAMAKDPKDRYQAPRDILRALAGVAAGGADTRQELATIVGPLPEIPAISAGRRVPRLPVWAVAGVIAVVVVVFVGALGIAANRLLMREESGGGAPVGLVTGTAEPSQTGSEDTHPTTGPHATHARTRTTEPAASYTVTSTATPMPPTATFTPLPSSSTPIGGGGRVAFASTRDGNWEIYAMNADGTGLVNLTKHPADDLYPSWSPDGTRIAFYSNRDGNDEIYVMEADGVLQTNLTSNPADDVDPAWSPDGTRIAFVSLRDDPSPDDCYPGCNYEIYVMKVDGGGVVRLTDNPRDDWEPSWSPDGGRIAFSSWRDSDTEVYVMRADGADQLRLTDRFGHDGHPSWSPGGLLIAFVSDRDGGDGIYVMDEDGSATTKLTRGAVYDTQPFWAGPGRILFVSGRDGGNLDIYLMNADGSGVTRLTTDPAWDGYPSWSPR